MTYETLTTPMGVTYGLLRNAGETNRPLLFHFGGSIEQSLAENFAGYPNATSDLPRLLLTAPNPWATVSIDLPCHGDYTFPGVRTQLLGWYDLAAAGVDFLAPLTCRVAEVLADMRARGIAHPVKCALSGVSRGAFAALRMAQAGIMANIACISPVTKLSVLSEFTPALPGEPLALVPGSLINKSIYASITNRDDRVSNVAMEQTLQAIVAAHTSGVPIDVSWEVAYQPTSHGGHEQIPDAPIKAARWILSRWGEAAL